ncbi:MAG: sugar phosphate isomerase/epimerase, partial [Gemmatimonadales bacterium]|nr:sugar phosphate isomerase/epimerase [Gemmatimonadales bacterium]
MSKPIAVQLYSVSDQLEEDFAGTIRRVADMGYVGVETAGFPADVKEAAQLFSDLDLKVCSAHTDFPLPGAEGEAIVKNVQILGATRIISGFGPEELA